MCMRMAEGLREGNALEEGAGGATYLDCVNGFDRKKTESKQMQKTCNRGNILHSLT